MSVITPRNKRAMSRKINGFIPKRGGTDLQGKQRTQSKGMRDFLASQPETEIIRRETPRSLRNPLGETRIAHSSWETLCPVPHMPERRNTIRRHRRSKQGECRSQKEGGLP